MEESKKQPCINMLSSLVSELVRLLLEADRSFVAFGDVRGAVIAVKGTALHIKRKAIRTR